jgi:hypothetical protein
MVIAPTNRPRNAHIAMLVHFYAASLRPNHLKP